MAGYVDKYTFALMLDAKNFQKGTNLAQNAVNGLRSTLLKTYAAIGGIDLFKNMLSNYSGTANDLDKLTTLTNENAREIQAWQRTVSDAGGDVKGLNATLGMLSESMAQVKNYGTSSNMAFFQRLGISVTNQEGKLKTGAELLKDVGNAINTFPDKTQGVNLARQIGIDDGTIKAMLQYGSALDTVLSKNRRLSLFDKSDVNMSREYQKMLSDLRYSWQDVSRTLAVNIIPILKDDLFPELKKLGKWFADNKTEVRAFFKNFGTEIRNIMPLITGLAKILGWVGDRLKDFSEFSGKKAGEASGNIQKELNLRAMGLGDRANYLREKMTLGGVTWQNVLPALRKALIPVIPTNLPSTTNIANNTSTTNNHQTNNIYAQNANPFELYNMLRDMKLQTGRGQR